MGSPQTQAIVLAAGMGTRCHPLTAQLNKCMLELAGKTLLAHQHSALLQNDIKHITVVGGHQYQAIEQAGYPCLYNPLYATSNMVASLFCAESLLLQGKTTVIAYGDIVYQADRLHHLLNTPGELVIMSDVGWCDLWSLRFPDVLADAESFVVNDHGQVMDLGQPVTDPKLIQGQFTGLIKVDAAAGEKLVAAYHELIRSGLDEAILAGLYMTDFIRILISKGWSVMAAEVNRGWLEVDSADDLALYQRLYDSNQLQGFYSA